jgi:hypothetical protein
MSDFRFSIGNNRTHTVIVIDEPVGWDKNKIRINRDPEWHGVFFSRQGDDFMFDGLAEQILKAEYDEYGAQGDLSLIIEENCGEGYEFFESGKFVFLKYDHSSGPDCFVKIPVEQESDMMTIRNRMDQKVNLETTVAFDETTPLTPYAKLPFTIMLPSKGIFIQDELANDAEFTTPVQGVPINDNPGGFANSEYGMIEVGFDNNKFSEIGFCNSLLESLYTCVITAMGSFGCAAFDRFPMSAPIGIVAPEICPLQISPWLNFPKGSPNYDAVDNPVTLDLLINGRLEVLVGNVNAVWFCLMVLPDGAVGNVESDYVYVMKNMIYYAPGPGLPAGSVINLNQSYTDTAFVLNKGDRIYGFYALYNYRDNVDQLGQPGFQMTFDAGNYFKINNISHTDPSLCKMFAINETLSRITEAITNDTVKVKSDFYGRTDSEPYVSDVDGDGSLKAITDGLRIRRQENKIPGTTSVFAQSLKDAFNGLRPIDNIGAGLEADTVRGGDFKWLRVEPWQYFYNNSVILSCTNIRVIKRAIFEKEIYSTFKFGFQKWEAEEYNGLDEFLTKREYRTTLKEVNNSLLQISSFVGSGFAWEITRRIGNNDSKDWRYDKETFVSCLTRTRKFHVFFEAAGNRMYFDTETDGSEFLGPGTITISGSVSNNGIRTILGVSILTVPGQPVRVEITFTGGATIDEESYDVTFDIVSPAGLFIELGNIINAANIIEPRTLYNYRISPVRTAMRWMNRVLESYKKFDANAKILFTDGDGNYFAEGEMESAFAKLENGTLTENMTISGSIFSDPADATPFLLPERVMFEFPMLGCDYKAIKANPGGLIYFENECEKGYGHISDIVYRPAEGMANFNLIPAITSSVCFPVGVIGSDELPDAVVGDAYNQSITLSGDAPFTLNIVTKPAWMTIALVGNVVTMTGTPLVAEFAVEVNFEVYNCDDANIYNLVQAIEILEALGDIEFTCAGGSIDPIPFGVAGTYNWDMNITTATAGRVHIVAHNSQVGSLNGYAIFYEGDIIIAPGATTITIPLEYDGGGINIVNNLTVTCTDSSGSSGCDEFLFSYD